METGNKHRKRIFMWHKVTELFSRGFNKSQISMELGIDRGTVRRYLGFSESDFYHWIEQGRHLPKKLDQYYKEVQNLIERYPYLSSSQVEDRLKENHPDLPVVHSKTVYNFVQRVRIEQDISKEVCRPSRQYEKLPDPAYGDQGQVDWGQYHMLKKDGGRQTVYFIVIVLSRSRQKYLYFNDFPFNTNLTIKAHNLAFTYFRGQPGELLYDQDRVLVVDENMGDIILTKEFSTYCSGMAFKAVFCRKADPESKGKVENVVQFVKKNFLRGGEFEGLDRLNAACLEWLSRTGNGKVHAATRKIPHQERVIEKEFLLPLPVGLLSASAPTYQSYNVRKDNTISYQGNYYTLPLGTYQGRNSKVLIRLEEDSLLLYDADKNILATHKLSALKGQTIRNTDHHRDKSQSPETLKKEVLSAYDQGREMEEFIGLIELDKPRYLRDNLRCIKEIRKKESADLIKEGIEWCLAHKVYNANHLKEFIGHLKQERDKIRLAKIPLLDPVPINPDRHLQAESRSIDTYQQIFNHGQ